MDIEKGQPVELPPESLDLMSHKDYITRPSLIEDLARHYIDEFEINPQSLSKADFWGFLAYLEDLKFGEEGSYVN
jgi:hypothetical protein